MEIETRLYMDTNVLRYFGTAFAGSTIDEDLRNHFLLSPISIMELLSQLATDDTPEILAAIQAMLRVFNPQHTGVLPWSDDFFRMTVFNVPPKEDIITGALNNAINNCLNAEFADDLKADAQEMQNLLKTTKTRTCDQFAAVLKRWMVEGELSEEALRVIFAHSIAHRAEVSETSVNVDTTIQKLDALYTFEKAKLTRAAKAPGYNPHNYENDVFDAELLVYLADITLHLLTSDRGLYRAKPSSQSGRIHIVPPDCMRNQECATQTLRDILNQSVRTLRQCAEY